VRSWSNVTNSHIPTSYQVDQKIPFELIEATTHNEDNQDGSVREEGKTMSQIQTQRDQKSAPRAADPERLAAGKAQTIAHVRPVRNRRAMRWRAIAYMAAVLPLGFLLVAFWIDPDLRRQEITGWKPIVTLADTALVRGDPYETRFLYVRAGRIASWREDWEGLLAAACGMKKLDNASAAYSDTHAMLIRAMMAAQTRASRAGMVSVAKAFAAIDENKAAAMVLAQIGPDWPEEVRDSFDLGKRDCWG
jgi:hypothetical protein